MDVPSPSAGTVKDLKVKLGDKVSEGSVILTLDAAGSKTAPTAAPPPKREAPAPSSPQPSRAEPAATRAAAPSAGGGGVTTVKVPDIGDFRDVPIIEVLVKPGDTVKAEDALITLESDKATMDVPAPVAGVVKELKVKLGDKVSEGSVILTLESQAAGARAPEARGAPAAPPAGEKPAARPEAEEARPPAPAEAAEPRAEPIGAVAPAPVDGEQFKAAHASPSVRAFARELGVDLSKVTGTGPKGRVLHDDVQGYVKRALSGAAAAPAAPGAAGAALGLLPWPQVDFAKFGEIEKKPLSRIKKISGANLHRNWVMIPHVTNCEDADITELEAFRIQLNKENEKSGVKLTLLAFLIKACVAALRKFPDFNASLDGDSLVYKKYFHIGFAADTPNGLVVPVVKNADEKGVLAIAGETASLAAKAREGKLGPADMQGGCFSISSLGGFGGTYFTPIINAPEVAILGVCRSATRPVWNGREFAPRLILPLSLSYDHRVIDGASAARFNSFLAGLLGDMRRVVL
jgi:pyruvate dehydrogenase E2 component (dihydrolipoamide acetyltransferase)